MTMSETKAERKSSEVVIFQSSGLNAEFAAVTCELVDLEKVVNRWSGLTINNEWRWYEPVSIAWNAFGKLLVLLKCVHREKKMNE